MARVSKAASCQSAVMRTTPPNDPPVKRRRSEAGDWGKKCLQVGRQSGNSSGEGDVARYRFGTVTTIPRIAEDPDAVILRFDEPVFGNVVLSVNLRLKDLVAVFSVCRGNFSQQAGDPSMRQSVI